MAGNTFLRWLVPAIVTVGGGTALAIALTGTSLSSDLTARADAAIASTEFSWAGVSVEGRDAILTGVATMQSDIDTVTARLAEVHGIRLVNSMVTLAEVVSPFPFVAIRNNGENISISGGFPDESSHRAILAAAPNATDRTRLLSGGPDSATFTRAAVFGLDALKLMDEGEVKLADLALTIDGRAESPASYKSLTNLQNSVPAGVTTAAIAITPPVVSPFTWTASFDGKVATITGFAETPDLATNLKAAVSSVTVSTDMSVASGSPEAFDANALILLKALLQLESGTATISDGTISLTGAPATADAAIAVTKAVNAIGGTVTLEPPRIVDFSFSATKAADGISFLGFVPDGATRDKLTAIEGADVTGLNLGRGAPEGFSDALDLGLAALAHLSEGEFSLSANRLSLTGRAITLADLTEVGALVEKSAPAGLSLDQSEIRPPVADPFTFSAIRNANGATSVNGFVPDEAVRSALLDEIDAVASDTAVIADGAPDTFAVAARSGLAVLSLLDTGTLAFDGAAWSLTGNVDTAQKAYAADAAFSIAGLRKANWTYAVTLPPAPAPAALPIIDPYVWGAQRALDGRITFTGFSPSAAFKSYLAVKAGADTIDPSGLGAGAPENFIGNALAGLEALLALDEGALTVSGTTWSLTGSASNARARVEVQDRLSSKTDPAQWRVTIQAPEAAPVVSPYLWSAEKAADGTVILAGYMPSDALRKFVATRAGTVNRDSTEVASGEPSGFSDDVLAGLVALSHLASGKASFDGSQWSLSGNALSADEGEAASQALLGGSRAGTQWRNEISAPIETAEVSSQEETPATDETIISLEPPQQPAVEAPSSASPEPSAEQPASAAQEAVPSVEEPAEVSTPEPVPVAAPSAAPADPPLPVPASLVFEAARQRGQGVALSGAVPAEAARSYFGVVAGNVATEAVTIDPKLPPEFITNAMAAIAGVNQLVEGRSGFDGKRWWLSGKAADETIRNAVVASVEALPSSVDWSVKVDLVPAVDLCRDTVNALAARNVIVFQSGSARLADTSTTALDELAVDLRICPDAIVHVEGHTDADGPEEINLALSVSRAEAVVEALIERGVAIERLYAEGYGESMPIASNETRDGKQANRRIAFTITEGD
ncbi:MAG: OmpA family protein [Devosia sp.]